MTDRESLTMAEIVARIGDDGVGMESAVLTAAVARVMLPWLSSTERV